MFNTDTFSPVVNNINSNRKWYNYYGGYIIETTWNGKTGKITKKMINHNVPNINKINK